MLLQPCEGTQRLAPSLHSPSALELVNDSPNHCRVTSPHGQVFTLDAHETISIPLPGNASASKQKVTFSVNRAGRTFTVYGEVSPTSSPGNAFLQSSPTGAMVTPPSLSKRTKPASSVSATSVTAAIPAFSNEESLLLCTENLINARLGGSQPSGAGEGVEIAPKSPHAKLSAMQCENAQRNKAAMVKAEIAPVLDLLRERLETDMLKVRAEASFDLGLKEKLWDLLSSFYESIWLGFALTHLGPALDSASPNATLKARVFDLLFTNSQLMQDPSVKRQGAFPENAEFKTKMSRHLAFQVLQLVLFLDKSKPLQSSAATLLGKTCLFRATTQSAGSANAKSSDQVLAQLANLMFQGEGDLTRNLKKVGYQVTHRQSALDEYDSRIPTGQLVPKVRDGVILSMLLESYSPCKLLSTLRIPARERLHCITNNEKLVDQIERVDATLLDLGTGRLTKYDIVDGKCTRILELIWKLVLRFGIDSVVNQNALWREVRNVAWKHRNEEDWQDKMQTFAVSGNVAPLPENATLRLERLLLIWVQTVCATFAGYNPAAVVRDFSASLSDGIALCLLVNYYHPSLLPLDQVYLGANNSNSAGKEEQQRESERMRLERRNFALFNAAVDAIGEIPIRLSSHHFKHVLPAQLGFSSLAFLSSRTLMTMREVRAAQKIQTVWAVARAKRLGTKDSATKAKRMVEQEQLRAQSDQEDGAFEGLAVRNFFQRVLALRSSTSPLARQPSFDENARPAAATSIAAKTVMDLPVHRQKNASSTPNSSSKKKVQFRGARREDAEDVATSLKQSGGLTVTAESPFQEEREKRQESARRAQAQIQAKRLAETEDAQAREAELQQQREWQQRVRQQQQERWVAEPLQEKRRMFVPVLGNEVHAQQQQRLYEEEQQRLYEEEQQRLYEEEQQRLYEEEQQRLYEEEQQRLYEEEQQRLYEEEQQRLQREEEQRLYEEEQQRLQAAEQQRLQREKEQRLQREEQQRLYEEEQQRLQREEQQRLQREEQQRLQREEQQRLQREEQQRLQREEQQRIQAAEQQRLYEKEQQRLYEEEQQRLEREEQQREEEEQRLEMEQRMAQLEQQRLAFENDLLREQEEMRAYALRREQETHALEAQLQLAQQQRQREEDLAREQSILAQTAKARNAALQHEQSLLEERIIRQNNFLAEERARMERESANKLKEVERLEQLHREEAQELERLRVAKQREREALQELERARLAKERQIQAIQIAKQQEADEQQQCARLEHERLMRRVEIEERRLREQEERIVLYEAQQRKPPMSADKAAGARKLFALLQDPAHYLALFKHRSSLIWENRDCFKMFIFALRRCTRAQTRELAALLLFAHRSFGISAAGVPTHRDLSPHLASALIDVLQTFYDQDRVFDLAWLVLLQISTSYSALLSAYEHRLATLHALLETKLEIQRLCHNTAASHIIATNLSRLNSSSS